MLLQLLSGAAGAAAAANAPDSSWHGRLFPPAYVAFRSGIEYGDANQFRFREGVMGSVAAGTTIGRRGRAELAVARRSTPITRIPPLEADGNFSNWSVMLNAYVHPFKRDERISPYIGAGVGYATSKLSGYSTEEDDAFNGLGYVPQRHSMIGVQGIVGVAFRASEKINVDLAGVYYTTGDRNYNSTFANNPTVEASYRTWSMQIGVRFRF